MLKISRNMESSKKVLKMGLVWIFVELSSLREATVKFVHSRR
jgi:hypothetical protein